MFVITQQGGQRADRGFESQQALTEAGSFFSQIGIREDRFRAREIFNLDTQPPGSGYQPIGNGPDLK